MPRHNQLIVDTAVVVGDRKAVRYATVSDQVELAIGDGSGKIPIGFTEFAIGASDSVTLHTRGPLDGFTGLTVGVPYFLSQSTAGEITATKPGSGEVVCVGIAKSATTLFVAMQDVSSSGSANRIARFTINGTITAGTHEDGVWIPDKAGSLEKVRFYLRQTGQGHTTIDVNKNGVSVWNSDQSLRPKILSSDPNGTVVTQTTFNPAGNADFVEGDKFSVDVDSAEEEDARDATIQLEVS